MGVELIDGTKPSSASRSLQLDLPSSPRKVFFKILVQTAEKEGRGEIKNVGQH